MQWLYVLVVVVSAATAQEVVDMNEYFDKALESANRIYPAKVPITFNISTSDIELGHGLFNGMNTLVRTGNCHGKILNNSNFEFEAHVGFRHFDAEYIYAKLRSKPVSGRFTVRKNSIHIALTAKVLPLDECEVRITEFRWERLDKVTFHSPNQPEYDGIDVSRSFREQVLPQINEEIRAPGGLLEQLNNRISEPICLRLRLMAILSGQVRFRRSTTQAPVEAMEQAIEAALISLPLGNTK